MGELGELSEPRNGSAMAFSRPANPAAGRFTGFGGFQGFGGFPAVDRGPLNLGVPPANQPQNSAGPLFSTQVHGVTGIQPTSEMPLADTMPGDDLRSASLWLEDKLNANQNGILIELLHGASINGKAYRQAEVLQSMNMQHDAAKFILRGRDAQGNMGPEEEVSLVELLNIWDQQRGYEAIQYDSIDAFLAGLK